MAEPAPASSEQGPGPAWEPQADASAAGASVSDGADATRPGNLGTRPFPRRPSSLRRRPARPLSRSLPPDLPRFPGRGGLRGAASPGGGRACSRCRGPGRPALSPPTCTWGQDRRGVAEGGAYLGRAGAGEARPKYRQPRGLGSQGGEPKEGAGCGDMSLRQGG